MRSHISTLLCLSFLLPLGCSATPDGTTSAASAATANNGGYSTYLIPYRDGVANSPTLRWTMEFDQLIDHGRSRDIVVDSSKTFAYTRDANAKVLSNATTFARTVGDVVNKNGVLFSGSSGLDFISGQGDTLADNDPLTALMQPLKLESEYTFQPSSGEPQQTHHCTVDAEFPATIQAFLLDEEFFKGVPATRPDLTGIDANNPKNDDERAAIDAAARFDELDAYHTAVENARKALRSGAASTSDVEAIKRFRDAHAIKADLTLKFPSAAELAILGVNLTNVPPELQGKQLAAPTDVKTWSDSPFGRALGSPSCNYSAATGILVTTTDGAGNPTGYRAGSCAAEAFLPNLDAGPWTGEYFDNERLAGIPVVRRTDTKIDFDWGAMSPDPLVPVDHFSARWHTDLKVDQAASYTFAATVDDGVRVSVDGEVVIDQWRVTAPQHYEANKQLGAGIHDVVVEYFEATGGALAKVAVRPTASNPPDALGSGALPMTMASNLRAFIGQTMIRSDYAAACDQSPSGACVAPRIEVFFPGKAGQPRRFAGRIETDLTSGLKLSNLDCKRL